MALYHYDQHIIQIVAQSTPKLKTSTKYPREKYRSLVAKKATGEYKPLGNCSSVASSSVLD